MHTREVQVLWSIGQVLAKLHEAQWAHFNLKPKNFVYLPSQQRWALVGFGSACRIHADEVMPTFKNVHYSAPDIVAASEDCRLWKQPVKPHQLTAADVWAFGVCLQFCPGAAHVYSHVLFLQAYVYLEPCLFSGA